MVEHHSSYFSTLIRQTTLELPITKQTNKKKGGGGGGVEEKDKVWPQPPPLQLYQQFFLPFLSLSLSF